MKSTALILLLAASTLAASAQTPAKPPTAAAKPATTAAKPAATAAKSAAAADKLPANIPPVKAIKKTLFDISLRYQDVKIGDGAAAETGKLLKLHYTLWIAADGTVFDSSHTHPGQPLRDKDGKPVLGDDGKPKLGEPLPLSVIMGQGRPLPGWDLAFEGMKAGGERRVFIPWQLGFGPREIPHEATHSAAPAKSDLILEIELIEVTDAPAPSARPGMMGGHPPMGAHPMPMPGAPPAPGAAPKPAAPAAPATPATPTAPATTPVPVAPAAPGTPAAPAAPSTPPQPAAK
jgi:peptidylprolyl isomerase